MKSPLLFIFCFLLFTACNAVYLEKPMPQSGKDQKTIPAHWSGVYELIEPDKNSDSALFKQCLRMERLSNTQLFISGETRLAKKDVAALKQLFLKEQKAGRLLDFQITNRFIYSTVNTASPEKEINPERQITTLVSQGDWYVLANSIKPLMLIDLDTKTVTNFDVPVAGSLGGNDLIPEADSLSADNVPLVFRQKQQTYFLNVQPQGHTNWLLYTISGTGKSDLAVKLAFQKDKKNFEQRLDYYNKITPFLSMGSDYLINPTDEALDQLLADPDLFEGWYLKKIGEE